MSPSNHIPPAVKQNRTFSQHASLKRPPRSPDTLTSCERCTVLFELGLNCSVRRLAALQHADSSVRSQASLGLRMPCLTCSATTVSSSASGCCITEPCSSKGPFYFCVYEFTGYLMARFYPESHLAFFAYSF